MRTAIFIFALLLSIAPPAAAADPATQPAMDAAVAPFVTAGTLLVAKADLADLDVAAIHDVWVASARSALDPSQAQPIIDHLDALLPQSIRWLTDFHNAGGRYIYAVAFLGDPADIPGVLIVPVNSAQSARAIAGLLVSGDPLGPDHRDDIGPPGDTTLHTGVEAVEMNSAVLYGLTPQVEKMKLARPVDRPMLAAALAAVADAQFEIACSPSFALQLVAGEALPDRLPDAAGGGSPADLVHTLAWAAWGGTPPPKASMELRIQCSDAFGAQEYAAVFDALLSTMSSDPAQRKLIPVMDRLVAALRPTLQDDHLTLNLDAQTFSGLILPRLLQGWRAAAIHLWSPEPATQPSVN